MCNTGGKAAFSDRKLDDRCETKILNHSFRNAIGMSVTSAKITLNAEALGTDHAPGYFGFKQT